MSKRHQLVSDFTAISSPTGKFLPTAGILQVSDVVDNLFLSDEKTATLRYNQ
jgi:hypothetical protein